jgi:hypothetical protein
VKLSDVFARMGGELIDTDQQENVVTVLARIKKGDPSAADRWSMCIDTMLDAAAEAHGAWNIDISRQYVRRNGRTVYFWRWILSGNTKAALTALVARTRPVTAGAPRVEFESFPAGPGRSEAGVNRSFTGGGAGVYTAKGVTEVHNAHSVSSKGMGMAVPG